MPMRDASAVGTKTTLSLPGGAGTTVVSTAIDLVGANPMASPLWAHVYYPSNPTGTGPSIKATLTECATSGGTYTDVGMIHNTDANTSGFPKEFHQGFVPRLRFLKVSFTLANTDNVYGTVQIWISSRAEERRSWP